MNRRFLLATILLHFSSATSRETIVSIDDKDKTQYHEVNFDTRSYNFGYDVGPNGQFHHEIRGSDGVTYGCFGYFDADDKLLMTHYVADAHGYRLIESNKPVKIYPVVADPKSTGADKDENSIEPNMILTEWKDLYLPKGCRTMENGNFHFNRNEQDLDDSKNIPQPGIGSKSHIPPNSTAGGIGGTFTGAHGTTGSFGIGGSHSHFPAHNPDSQGSFAGGMHKPIITHNHTSPNQPSSQGSSSDSHGAQHGGSFSFGHISGGHQIIHNHETTSQKPHNFEHGGSFSHGHLTGGHHISHNHESTSQKPHHFEHGGSFEHGPLTGGHHISHNHESTSQKPHHFEHGGSFEHGHLTGGHHISHNHETTSKKPHHFEHGGSFQHGSISGGHQIIHTHETTSSKPAGGSTTTTQKPTGHFEHGGSFIHGGTSGDHHIGISWGHGQNQGQSQGNNQGNSQGQNQNQNQGSNHGQNQGSNHGQNQGSNHGQNQGSSHGQNQGSGYNPDYNGGYYQPDNSGYYVHQPGPNALPYVHETGPQGGHGGQGGNGNYGQNGPSGPFGPNGPDKPYQPSEDFSPEYGYPGGHRPDPNNPDANCNHPGHNHHHHHHQQTYPTSRPPTRPTTTSTRRPTTKTTTSSTTTRKTTHRPTRPSTYPTRPSTTPTKPQTYPTRPNSTPNPTGSPNGNIGVQPPSTRPPQSTPNPNQGLPGSHLPLFFVPYPFPIAPTCPCYYMHNHGNNHIDFSGQSNHGNAQGHFQSSQQYQPYAIGLIPILFVPHCMPSGNYSNNIPGQYLQVPYPCAQCNQHGRDGRELDINAENNSNEVYSSSDSFKQVLAQAGVNPFDVFQVRSQPRRMRMKKLKLVQQKSQDENETQENQPIVVL